MLLNDALNVASTEAFDLGIASLINVRQESRSTDKFLCNNNVWMCQLVLELFNRTDFASKAALQYLQQIQSIDRIIESKREFDQYYERSCNAFLGIDFSNCTIPNFCQISEVNSYHSFCKNCFSNFSANEVEELIELYEYLFPKYHFSKDALEDMLYWNQSDFDNYTKALSLLEDIQQNPFTGGLGQTEILKYAQISVCSKRINLPNRITYSYENNKITVIRCRGHYNK